MLKGSYDCHKTVFLLSVGPVMMDINREAFIGRFGPVAELKGVTL